VTYYWFSTYTGNRWTPDKGYNETFKLQVVQLRNWFRLQKAGLGREQGTGYWRQYVLQGRNIYVTVDQLTWNGYKGDSEPRVRFKMDIRLSNLPEGKDIFFKDTITIHFPKVYPEEPPLFRPDRFKGYDASHKRHLFAGGWLCILGNSKDWDDRRDTIISALNAALDWIVWHTYSYVSSDDDWY
jgi:hypothetical protein